MSGVVSVIVFAIMVAVILLGVIFRYVMKSPFEWTEELARFLMLAMGFLAMNMSVRDNGHLSIDVIVDLFPKNIVALIGYLVDLLCCFFLVFLTWKGCNMAFGTIMTAASMDISMFWPYLLVPVGAGLVLLQFILKITGKICRSLIGVENPGR